MGQGRRALRRHWGCLLLRRPSTAASPHPTLFPRRSLPTAACRAALADSRQRKCAIVQARKHATFQFASFRAFYLIEALIRLRQKAIMHVIVLASQKGGAGKTTLAAHLAVAAEAASAGPAVLIDADPQGSLSAWWNVREAQIPALAPATIAELPAKLTALAEAGYAVAVVDTPPAITEAIAAVVQLADLVVIPTRPSPHDLRAVGRTVELVQAAGKAFVFAVTQAKPNAKLTVQAMAALSEHGVVAP